MMTTQPITNIAPPMRQELPGDLRPLVGECILIKLALEAVDVVADQLPLRPTLGAGSPGPRILLTLLTYSYAAGTFATEDIEWNCQHDAATRYVSGNANLDQDTLRAFRRANRPWIEACLALVLQLAHRRLRQEAAPSEPERSLLVAEPDSAFLQLARRRLELATLMDMAMAD